MVSLQAALSPKDSKVEPNSENYPVSKKRKWVDSTEGEAKGFIKELEFWKVEEKAKPAAVSDIELHLDSPLPVEWQRCLDIQSGQIHFYNSRTKKRTSRDPRQKSPDQPLRRPPMSLDLELNLTCESPTKHKEEEEDEDGGGEEEEEDDRREMVARVCLRCHMLVMMCKSSPACPNCKFLHPPEQGGLPAMFKPGFRLLCRKDFRV